MITDSQIASLRAAAGSHGDMAMSALCTIALGDRELFEAESSALTGTYTEESARAECARVIAAANAQHEVAE